MPYWKPSPQQERIRDWFANGRGNLVIRARAGTGKSSTMVWGVGFAPEQRILFCAFNKKIATELQVKVPAGTEAKTLHSLGFSFIRRAWNGVRVDDERGWRLARAASGADGAPDEMTKLVAKLASVAKGVLPFPTLPRMVDLCIDFDCDPDESWEEDGWTTLRVADCAMKAMDAAAKPDGAVDFDDMVFVPVRNRMVRGWYDLVIVDEAQDMTKSQTILAMGACKPGGRIAVVGDDRQAIYGFRGADSGSIDRLKSELRATELRLTITRRCPKAVVDLAKRLVPDFEAAPEAPHGKITSEPMSLLPKLAQVGDFVLSRKNAPLAGACLSILREGKRARVEGRDIGKGLIALVGKLAKGKAASSMPAWLERLGVWEARECARWAKTKEAKVEEAKDRADTLRFLADGLTGIPELKSRIADLFTDNAQEQGCVVLSSIHRAKGLEADRVFIMRDTLYPGGRRDDPEERNLEYVAITRSKNHLIWLDDKPATAVPIIPAAPPAK